MTNQITAERAIEAINICSKFMTDSMTPYQSTLYPQCLRIAGETFITSSELEKLTNAGFYCQITSSSTFYDYGLEIIIYEKN